MLWYGHNQKSLSSLALGTIEFTFCWCPVIVCHRWTVLGLGIYFSILSWRDNQHC